MLKILSLLFLFCSSALAQVTIQGGVTISGGVGIGLAGATTPAVNLSPSSLAFGSVVQNVTSPPQIATLTNTGTGTLTITSIITTGNFADTTGCGGTLAAGANCQITVTFTPLSVASLTGAVTITDNAAGSPHIVSLSGTGTSSGTAVCGLTSDATLCGNLGTTAAYADVGHLSSPGNVSTCGNLSAGNWILTGNLNAGASSKCLNVSFPSGVVNVDLAGFTITGTNAINTNHASGMVFYNGTINCNSTDPCLLIQPGESHLTSQMRVAYLTVNQSHTGTDSLRIASNVQTAVPSVQFGVRVDHVDEATYPSQPASTRNSFIRVLGPYNSVLANYNKFTPPNDAAACQGIQLYESPASQVSNNYINFLDPNVITGDSCRAILLDSEGKYGAAGTGGNSVAFNNYIHAGANRAFRVRAEQADVIHNNTVTDCNLGGRLGCYHVGENDVATEYASATIYNETCTSTNGNCIVSTGDQNVSVVAYSNTILCTGACNVAGYAARTDALISGQQGALLNIKNTTLGAGFGNAVGVCGTAPTPQCTITTAHSVATVCNTGTVVSGTGAVVTVNSQPCP